MRIRLTKIVTENLDIFHYEEGQVYIVSSEKDIIKDDFINDFTNVGIDLYALEDVVIYSFDTKIIKTGVKVATPLGLFFEVRPRSSTPLKTKLLVANSPGTIDPNYRGDVGIIVRNVSEFREKIEKYNRIAQLCLIPYIPITNTYILNGNTTELQINYYLSKNIYDKWEELIPSDRGIKGFGSTGGYN